MFLSLVLWDLQGGPGSPVIGGEESVNGEEWQMNAGELLCEDAAEEWWKSWLASRSKVSILQKVS